MSYSSGGPSASYVPPPPPASKRSPWLWVGLGCGLTTLLLGGGCVAMVFVAGNKIKADMDKPLDKTALMQDLGNTPIYPGAQLDEMQTKAGRAGFSLVGGMIPADKTVVSAFQTDDPADKVLSWYDTKLGDMGFKEKNSVNEKQHQFIKDKEMIMVQSQASKSGKYTFLLIRITGIRGEVK